MLLSMFHLSNVLTFNLGLFISYCKVHLLLPKRHVQILRLFYIVVTSLTTGL